MLPAFMSCSSSATRYSCSMVVGAAAGAQRNLRALELARAGQREQAVQFGPFRGNPLFVAVQADLRVEAQVDDLPAQELGQQLLPLGTLRVMRHFARKRVVGDQKRLREVEQRRPQLMLDLRAARRVLDVLDGQALAQSAAVARRGRTRLRAAAAMRLAAGSEIRPSSARTSPWIASGSLVGNDASQRSADLVSASGSRAALPNPNISGCVRQRSWSNPTQELHLHDAMANDVRTKAAAVTNRLPQVLGGTGIIIAQSPSARKRTGTRLAHIVHIRFVQHRRADRSPTRRNQRGGPAVGAILVGYSLNGCTRRNSYEE